MGLLIRTVQRIAIFAIGAVSIWLIVFVVFDFADQELPVYFALMATYAIGAYIILPYAVRMGLKVAQRRHVPSFTVAADGLPADPVNLVLVGTLDQLRAAFAAIGWVEADKLNLGSSWRMVKAFVLDGPIRRRRSRRCTCSGAARTSAFKRRSATARASATTCASGAAA